MNNQKQNFYKFKCASQEEQYSTEVKEREPFDFDEYKLFIAEHMRVLQDLDQKLADQSNKTQSYTKKQDN